MRTMGDALNEHLEIVKEKGFSTTVTSDYMDGWSKPENGDWSYHNMYVIALDRIVKLEEQLEETDGYLSYEEHCHAKLKQELKECYDLHEVALEMVKNEQ